MIEQSKDFYTVTLPPPCYKVNKMYRTFILLPSRPLFYRIPSDPNKFYNDSSFWSTLAQSLDVHRAIFLRELKMAQPVLLLDWIFWRREIDPFETLNWLVSPWYDLLPWMALGTAASGPGGHFLRLINSGDLNKYKFNQKKPVDPCFYLPRNPKSEPFRYFWLWQTHSWNHNFGQKAPNLPIFCQKLYNSNVQFHLKFQTNRLRNKKVMPYWMIV
jgi:hypothetical protein